jgi:hypothetical protein
MPVVPPLPTGGGVFPAPVAGGGVLEIPVIGGMMGCDPPDAVVPLIDGFAADPPFALVPPDAVATMPVAPAEDCWLLGLFELLQAESASKLAPKHARWTDVDIADLLDGKRRTTNRQKWVRPARAAYASVGAKEPPCLAG